MVLRRSQGLLFLGVILLLLAGCARSQTAGQPNIEYRDAPFELPTGAPTPEPSPSSTRVLAQASPASETRATITPIPDEVRGLVVEVLEGDTIAVVLESDSPSQVYVVRYIGIDAPPNSPDNPWGVAAYEANRKMVGLQAVRLVKDQTDFDEEGNLLRYVYVDNQLMNIVITEQGLAQADISEPDTQFRSEIEGAEARARQGRLGVWSEATPTPTATRSGLEAEAAETEEPAPATETPESETPGTTTVEPDTTDEAVTGTPTVKTETTVTVTTTPAEESTPNQEAEATPTPGEDSDSEPLEGPQ
jgi:endonuclease YncB( thermonuclease family)